jgi:hypothetical protein
MHAHSAAWASCEKSWCGLQEEGGFLVLGKGDPRVEKALLEGAADVLNSAMTNPMFGVL